MGCELTGKCSHSWVYIGPTGKITQCGRAGDFEILPYGNIQNQTFEELLNHPYRDEIKNRTAILKEGECKDCRFWLVCNGGCPLDAIMVKGSINKKSVHCDWVKPFLEEYFEPVTGLVVSG
jgi:radical SAM protein with 4Fe4S-binding SPASM domain